jgi:DNA-binding MarR family transcriptional regulator
MGSNMSRVSETRGVLDAIRHIVQVLRESARAAEQHVGVSGAQLFVLHTLAESAPLALNDLAERTHTHQSSVSAVVARLVERGLVRRAWSAADSRRLELSLTARGQQLVDGTPDTKASAQARLIHAIDRLSGARRRMLASTLQELAQAVDAVDRIPPMFFEEHGRRSRRSRRTPRG